MVMKTLVVVLLLAAGVMSQGANFKNSKPISTSNSILIENGKVIEQTGNGGRRGLGGQRQQNNNFPDFPSDQSSDEFFGPGGFGSGMKSINTNNRNNNNPRQQRQGRRKQQNIPNFGAPFPSPPSNNRRQRGQNRLSNGQGKKNKQQTKKEKREQKKAAKQAQEMLRNNELIQQFGLGDNFAGIGQGKQGTNGKGNGLNNVNTMQRVSRTNCNPQTGKCRTVTSKNN